MKFSFAIALTAALSVSACLSTPSRRTETSAIFAERDKPVRAKHYRDVGPNCENRGYAAISLVNSPRGGSVGFRREGARPNFAANNPRFKCNAREVDGVGVYYTPAPGFAGPDAFSVEVQWADGARWTEDFTVQVR